MHPGASTEWWYFTGVLADPDGRTFGDVVRGGSTVILAMRDGLQVR